MNCGPGLNSAAHIVAHTLLTKAARVIRAAEKQNRDLRGLALSHKHKKKKASTAHLEQAGENARYILNINTHLPLLTSIRLWRSTERKLYIPFVLTGLKRKGALSNHAQKCTRLQRNRQLSRVLLLILLIRNASPSRYVKLGRHQLHQWHITLCWFVSGTVQTNINLHSMQPNTGWQILRAQHSLILMKLKKLQLLLLVKQFVVNTQGGDQCVLRQTRYSTPNLS